MGLVDRDIAGVGVASPAAIRAAIVDRGRRLAGQYAPDGLYREPPEELEEVIVEECRRYGPAHLVDHDGVTTQLNEETAGWQSKFAVERNNPGGIGAEDDNPDEAYTFATPAAGIRAHVAHLLDYRFGRGAWTADDPRAAHMPAGWFGICRTWRDLQGRWATSPTYAASLEEIWARLEEIIREVGGGMYEQVIPGLVDLRGELKRNPAGGPRQRNSLAGREGVVIHFNGPDVTATDDRAFIRDIIAPYHCQKNFARAGQPAAIGDGIMYHVGVGRDGTAYLQRDLEEVLWHCGDTEWNERSLSVYVPIGINQHATPAQLATLERVVTSFLAFTGEARDRVRGHQELSSTDCPGTLMRDFVHPYRAGEPNVPGVPVGEDPNARMFPETGKWVINDFLHFWSERGGLAVFGYPLTGQFQEGWLQVQYFERAVFEWHPENDDPWKVLLRRVGADALAERWPAGSPA